MQLSWKTRMPMDKKCLSGHLAYNASATNEIKHYYGTCEKNFKERYNNHTVASFRNKNKEKSTELSNYIWHNLKWCIASKACPYVCGSRKCDLCFTEKLTHHKSRS